MLCFLDILLTGRLAYLAFFFLTGHFKKLWNKKKLAAYFSRYKAFFLDVFAKKKKKKVSISPLAQGGVKRWKLNICLHFMSTVFTLAEGTGLSLSLPFPPESP